MDTLTLEHFNKIYEGHVESVDDFTYDRSQWEVALKKLLSKVSRHLLCKIVQIQGKVSLKDQLKAAQYKLFLVRNEKDLKEVCLFSADKWIDQIIDINRVSDRIIAIKVLFKGLLSQ